MIQEEVRVYQYAIGDDGTTGAVFIVNPAMELCEHDTEEPCSSCCCRPWPSRFRRPIRSATTVRVFNLKNASVSEAFAVIEPLLSEDGSVTVQPSRGRITIQDSPEVVGRISTLIDDLDRIPGRVSNRGGASRGPRCRAGIGSSSRSRPSAPPDVPLQVLSTRRPSTVFQGEFGQPTTASLSPNYRLSFLAESSSVPESTPWGVADIGNRTQVKWLRLDRLRTGTAGRRNSTRCSGRRSFCRRARR